MSDMEIDANFKIFLLCQDNGRYLTPKIVAHLDFFMNTLTESHRKNTEHPLEHQISYPALHQKDLAILVSTSLSDINIKSSMDTFS